jgi:uncharacterized protein (DUF2147 family)
VRFFKLQRTVVSRRWARGMVSDHGKSILLRYAANALAFCGIVALPGQQSQAAIAAPSGIWLMDASVAVQIFDCDNDLCGRILWLQTPRDPQGLLDRDKNNPDAGLRQRSLCGLTIFWGLHPSQPDKWEGGWFYNPRDGQTYNIAAVSTSPDVITARVYRGSRLFGRTKVLHRVSHGVSDGWC